MITEAVEEQFWLTLIAIEKIISEQNWRNWSWRHTEHIADIFPLSLHQNSGTEETEGDLIRVSRVVKLVPNVSYN